MKVFRLVLCLAGLVAYVATKQFLASQESVISSPETAPGGTKCDAVGANGASPGTCPLSKNAASAREKANAPAISTNSETTAIAPRIL